MGDASSVPFILSCIIILEYGYISTEVHLPLIAHKRTEMPHFKTRILSTGTPNRTLKIPHQKACIYGVDVSDTVKAIGVEIDKKFPHVN